MAKKSEKGNTSTSLRTKVKSERLKITENSDSIKRRLGKKGFLFILVLGLALLVFYKKEWVVAALVNNQPITTAELTQRLYKLHKEAVLNQLINEEILMQEAAKKGITVTQKEIDDKILELEEQYGGKESFEGLISQQGLTREEIARQTRFQLTVEKLYKDEATASAEEIEKFMEENSNIPEATEPAKFRELAEEQVKQSKLSQIFNAKFQALKQATKIQIF